VPEDVPALTGQCRHCRSSPRQGFPSLGMASTPLGQSWLSVIATDGLVIGTILLAIQTAGIAPSSWAGMKRRPPAVDQRSCGLCNCNRKSPQFYSKATFRLYVEAQKRCQDALEKKALR